MSRIELRKDVMADLLEELGVKLDREQLAQLTSDFAGHLEMEREEDSHQFSGPYVCGDCASKQRRINELEENARILERGCVRFARMPEDSSVKIEHGRVTVSPGMR